MNKHTHPRGKGTYVARYEAQCAEHGRHEVTIFAQESIAWDMARLLAQICAQAGCGHGRVLLSFEPDDVRNRYPRSTPTAAQIEDDIPF